MEGKRGKREEKRSGGGREKIGRRRGREKRKRKEEKEGRGRGREREE